MFRRVHHLVHGGASVVGPGQSYGDACNGAFAEIDLAVVIRVFPDQALNARGTQLGKVVPVGQHVAQVFGDDDVLDRVAIGRVVDRSA